MRGHHKRVCNICDKAFERNNYYFGKLMKVQDFEIEQSYFNKKRWLINRMILGWGVVCGLDVKQKNENEVIIEPGLAIDYCGREIRVCDTQLVSLAPQEDECNYEEKVEQTNGSEQYAICLKFKECKTESFPAFHSACDQKEKCQFNRIRDWFEIKVIPFSEQNKKSFCLKRDDCEDQKSLHQCICDWLCECPECCEPECVVLATVTLDNSHNIQEIDECSNRKLVYNNPLLYDLISCYHGDLPHVCQINWVHGKKYIWNDFQDEVVANGLKVTFNKPMNRDTVNKHTFLVAAITVEENTGYRLFRYIPADDIIVNNEVTEATFIFVQDSGGDEKGEGDEHSGSVSGLAEGAEIEIILRGSSIFSEDGKALDGSFRGNLPDSEEGDLPSGTGTQGSDFVSWFSVERKNDNNETYQ